VAAAIVEGGTAAAAGALTGFWLLINTMLSWLPSVALPGMLQARLLSLVLSLWNGASPVGLQVLLEKLQLIGSGLHVAPPQMVQFRDLVKGLSWLTLQPQHAAGIVFAMGMGMLCLLVLHLVALWAWKALPCTRARPVPEFLLFPVPELALANLMVLPLAMAATVLVMQTASPMHQMLGAICMLALLAYLGLVAAILVAVLAKKEMLGLNYVELDRRQGNINGVPSPAPDSAVLRFAPPHANGFWERAPLRLQRELRLAYQGAAASGCAERCARSKLCTHLHLHLHLHLQCKSRGQEPHTTDSVVPCAGRKRALVSLVSNLLSTRVESFPLAEEEEGTGPASRSRLTFTAGPRLLRLRVSILHAARRYSGWPAASNVSQQQVMMLEIQDRLGILFLDFK
jgi:hypothetical protein